MMVLTLPTIPRSEVDNNIEIYYCFGYRRCRLMAGIINIIGIFFVVISIYGGIFTDGDQIGECVILFCGILILVFKNWR